MVLSKAKMLSKCWSNETWMNQNSKFERSSETVVRPFYTQEIELEREFLRKEPKILIEFGRLLINYTISKEEGSFMRAS